MSGKVQVLLKICSVICIEVDVLHKYFNECTDLMQGPQKNWCLRLERLINYDKLRKE
jgi:hypothetical protein